jgi:hypothetical protein
MTLATADPRVEYVENGGTGPFAIPFQFFNADELVVLRITGTGDSDVEILTLGADYTIAGGYQGNGPEVGSLTLAAAGVNGATLRIDRDTDRSQLLHYIPGDDFPARSHEDGLDRLEAQIQELRRDNLSLEQVVDYLANHVLVAGPGISIVYDDEENTITISATTVQDALEELPDFLMLSGDQQGWSGEDPSGPGGPNLSAEDVQDIVAAMMLGVGGSWSYDDAGNKLTFTVTEGGGGGGGELTAILNEISATGINDNQLWVGDGPGSLKLITISDYWQAQLAEPDAAGAGFLEIEAVSLGNPGFVHFKSGLKMAWGTTSLTAEQVKVTNYAAAFDSYSICVGSGGPQPHAQEGDIRVTACSASGFTASNTSGETATFFYFAIGV